jgi:diadenosine tetraphosphate (Ap4A) HIT family hydrolase
MDTDPCCSFCKQYVLKTHPNRWGTVWGEKHSQNSDIVFEDENHVVIAGLGAVTEGYVLIVPKVHYTAAALMPESALIELEALKKHVRCCLYKAYGIEPFFFEHGSLDKPAGNSVIHVHIHACLGYTDLRPKLSRLLEEEPLNSLSCLKSFVDRNMSYILYEDKDEQLFAYSSPEPLPSQMVRRLWAQSVDESLNWDWRSFAGDENVAQTIELLRPLFQAEVCSE